MRVLIIEDEYALAEAMQLALKKQNYEVDIRTDGEDGYFQATSGIYDLIILDVMLPHLNGFEILKKIRNENINSKVIMLTAKSSLEDKLEGLENGANDYMTKPFHIKELTARVNIQLKAQNPEFKENIITYEDLKLDLSTSKLTCLKNAHSVELIRKELNLLEYFMINKGQILSKEQIYDKVWGIDNESESNNLEVYISFLRKKLKAISSNVQIKSLRGLGYKMEYNNE